MIMQRCMIRATRELDCSSGYIRLREPDKSEDKSECKATDNRTMGWQYHGTAEFDYSTTSVKSSWELRGMLQPEQKIEDLAKDEEMQTSTVASTRTPKE
ncbi:hypothetical protein BHE74_00012594 [Ensete ventricosum]|nr:hypothetical protein GW17_00048411 [Ensete ventricosum]RWW79136.1 hypothetical protein BHE74_00012594 [Ensete ventricosum]RZR83556.1 hypothetical protein BHM03_00010215 [Ensete ventricosum]